MKDVYNQFGQYMPRKTRLAKQKRRETITNIILLITLFAAWCLIVHLALLANGF